jgi:hypothetical protein
MNSWHFQYNIISFFDDFISSSAASWDKHFVFCFSILKGKNHVPIITILLERDYDSTCLRGVVKKGLDHRNRKHFD